MTPTPEQAARRNLRHALAFIIDSTIDMPTDKSDRDTLLMRLEAHVATLLAAREAAAYKFGFERALEMAADIHPNIRVTCDHEEADGSPGCACMGTVIHYRDSIRALGRET